MNHIVTSSFNPIGQTIFLLIQESAFENIMEKGENAGNQHFLLYPKCFLSYQRSTVESC